MQRGDILHGFKLLTEETVDEVNSKARLFLHEKSGAHLLHLENDDDNKVFYVAFFTPPMDDTGTPHIIEHSVLCGSRKYPLKEPFVELVKGSLNTFLNAMTYPDKTVYPVASRNDRDFKNLTDVYLDAVFYPKLLDDPFTLMQEGWHYEQDNEHAPLRYSGVVFNEMKGALSDPEGMMGNRVMAHLYPDTVYRFESGGDPKAIPSLTQEKFTQFHRRYYHPSNSLFYLYGDMDIDERLKYFDEAYLQHFSAIERAGRVTAQTPFTELRRVREIYPIGQNEDEREKTYLTLNIMLDSDCSFEQMFAVEVLSDALFKAEGAPLRQRLIDAKIGKDVDASLESEVLQPFFSVTAYGAEEVDADRFLATIEKAMRELAEKGISRSLLEATLASVEFRLRESDYGLLPKGLVYGLRSLSRYFYGKDPIDCLRYEQSLKNIKQGLSERYFEKLLQKLFIDNPHKLLLVMAPDRKMGALREQEESARLSAVQQAMSDEELRQNRERVALLKKRQAAPDSPEALATIPLLNLSDIKKETGALAANEREAAGTKVWHSDVETNGIAYVSLMFDALPVPKEKLPQLYLLSDIIGAMSTMKHSYAELDELLNLHTGGMDVTLKAFDRYGDVGSFLPRLTIESKALLDKIPQMTDILTEILTETIFDDKKRLQELVSEEISDIENSFQKNAQSLVASRIGANLGRGGRYDYEGTLPFYRYLKELAGNFDERFLELKADLGDLAHIVFNRHRMTTGVTVPEAGYKKFAASLGTLVSAMGDEKFADSPYEWTTLDEREGFMNAGQVQYVGKGANFRKLGFEYGGVLQVVTAILRFDYFWTKIRVQGGAYGAFANFRRNGRMYFGSYRDPNLRETIAVFDGTADYLRHFTATDREMTKFIIGTMSMVDPPLTPKLKGREAISNALNGVDRAMRQKWRDEVLATTQKDIRAAAELVDACMKENRLCVFGGEDKLKAEAELFSSLTQVSL